MRLPHADWQEREGLGSLLDALAVREGATRYVGGAVRDTLLGLGAKDVDLATRLQPEDVAERVARAGYKAVPTGIAHGTVTAVLPSGPIEVTTLRRDVATDGRHAVVAFTDDWREDAARRDFTINALFADPVNREIVDFFGGEADLADRRVRFIGDPFRRIAEDHLRILRFFRFHARFGAGAPDADGLAACAARANDLMALSRERIADELMKLLVAPHAADALAEMLAHRILAPVLPEIGGEGLARFRALVQAEQGASTAPGAIRRLAALLPPDPAVASDVAARLRLSKAQAKRLALAADAPSDAPPRALAYRLGLDAAVDRLLLDGRASDLFVLVDWQRPALPIGGGTLVERGVPRGPLVAATLQAIERRWIAENFPEPERVAAITAEEVARTLDAPS